MSRLKSFLQLFTIQLIQYCIVSVSFIALSHGWYGLTFLTDMVCGFNSFFIIKKIVKSEASETTDIIGFTLGGATGSMAAIWMTKHWFGNL